MLTLRKNGEKINNYVTISPEQIEKQPSKTVEPIKVTVEKNGLVHDDNYNYFHE